MEKSEEKEVLIIEHKGYKNQKITIDDIPEGTMRLVAELCGLSVAVSLMKHLKGITIAVPSNGFNRLEKRIILNEVQGSADKLKKVALNLEINEQTVREILRNYGMTVIDGQLSLFKKGEKDV